MRVALDTNVWSFIAERRERRAFDALARRYEWSVVVPPATLLVTDDECVSGRHASMTLKDAKLTITDEGSRNGTFIRIRERAELTDGDVLILGEETRLKITQIG